MSNELAAPSTVELSADETVSRLRATRLAAAGNRSPSANQSQLRQKRAISTPAELRVIDGESDVGDGHALQV